MGGGGGGKNFPHCLTNRMKSAKDITQGHIVACMAQMV